VSEETADIRRLERLDLWARGYRLLTPDRGKTPVHTAHAEVSRIDDDTFAHLSASDVEWLIRVARLAGAAAAEARVERAKFSPASFDEDFPAAAELARTVFTAPDADLDLIHRAPIAEGAGS